MKKGRVENTLQRPVRLSGYQSSALGNTLQTITGVGDWGDRSTVEATRARYSEASFQVDTMSP